MKLLTIEEIRKTGKDGEYIAVSKCGREYKAHYSTNYGGVMFFCIPSDVVIVGYKKVGIYYDRF